MQFLCYQHKFLVSRMPLIVYSKMNLKSMVNISTIRESEKTNMLAL